MQKKVTATAWHFISGSVKCLSTHCWEAMDVDAGGVGVWLPHCVFRDEIFANNTNPGTRLKALPWPLAAVRCKFYSRGTRTKLKLAGRCKEQNMSLTWKIKKLPEQQCDMNNASICKSDHNLTDDFVTRDSPVGCEHVETFTMPSSWLWRFLNKIHCWSNKRYYLDWCALNFAVKHTGAYWLESNLMYEVSTDRSLLRHLWIFPTDQIIYMVPALSIGGTGWHEQTRLTTEVLHITHSLEPIVEV